MPVYISPEEAWDILEHAEAIGVIVSCDAQDQAHTGE